MLLDAASEKAAIVFAAPKTGTIDRVGFMVRAMTTSATVDVRLETVDASGNPSGTLFGTNTNVAKSTLVANTYYEVTLTAGASVTRGQKLALVIVNPAVSAGNFEIGRTGAVISTFPFTAHWTGSWAFAGNPWIGHIRYSDGSYPRTEGFIPGIVAAIAYNLNATTDEAGNKMTLPFACKVSGIWTYNLVTSATGDWDAVLYDDLDNVIKSVSMDGDLTAKLASSNVPFICPFDSEITLYAGQVVRVIKKPTTATNVQIPYFSVTANAYAEALPGGLSVVGTTRVNAGAWTDNPAVPSGIGLIISALPDGAGRTLAFAG